MRIKNRIIIRFQSEQSKDDDKKEKLRDKFTFLGSSDCPLELQALVTVRISDYHAYQAAWHKLFDCASLVECAKTAGLLIDKFIDNRKIFNELNYYQLNHKVLGHHPIFRDFQQIKNLRKMNIKDLIRRQKQVENNIWRVKNEMAKNNKPQLDDIRNDRLKSYEKELHEINKLLGDE